MFKKLSQVQSQAEKRELFHLIRLSFSFFMKLAEFFSLLLLSSGLAWSIDAAVNKRIGAGAPAAGLSIALMLALLFLPRLIILFSRGCFLADFGLDPRPLGSRLKKIAVIEARGYIFVWLASLPIYAAMTFLNPWLWTLAAMIFGMALVFLNTRYPRLLEPAKLRPLAEDELSPDFTARLSNWSSKSGLPFQRLAISLDFSPYLKRPCLRGFGSTTELIMDEKTLVAFSPRSLNFLIASAVLENISKAPFSYLFIRLCAVAVAAPLAAMFLNMTESGLWLYPLGEGGPALICLVWLAAWVASQMSAVAIHLTRRSIEIQTAAAALIILRDEESLSQALDTLADRNLEENSPPAWREFFLPSYGRKNFLKRVNFVRHMAEFEKK